MGCSEQVKGSGVRFGMSVSAETLFMITTSRNLEQSCEISVKEPPYLRLSGPKEMYESAVTPLRSPCARESRTGFHEPGLTPQFGVVWLFFFWC